MAASVARFLAHLTTVFDRYLLYVVEYFFYGEVKWNIVSVALPSFKEGEKFALWRRVRFSHQYHPIPCHSSFHWMSHPSSPPPPPPSKKKHSQLPSLVRTLVTWLRIPIPRFYWQLKCRKGNHGVAPNPSWFSQFSIVLLLRASILDIVHFVWFDTKRRSLKIPGLETIQLDSTESKEYIKRNNFFFNLFSVLSFFLSNLLISCNSFFFGCWSLT